MKHLAIGALVLAWLGGCTAKETKVHLVVEAKTNQGELVQAAAVVLDGKKIGATGQDGRFQAELDLPAKTKKRLEIRKDSELYYFAPYFESFPVGSTSPQEQQVAATLYFVPKPGPAGAHPSKASAGLVAFQSTKVPPPKAPPIKDAAAAVPDLPPAARGVVDETTISEDELNAPGPLTQEKVPATAAAASPAIAPESKPAQTVAALPLPTPEPATKPDEDRAREDMEDAATASAGSVDDAGAEATAADTNKGPPTTQGHFVFTVHVFSGASPLADAEVAIGEAGSSALRPVCRSNARGRCVVRFPERPTLPVTFVARKTGYKTVTVSASLKLKDKLRLNLAAGRSLDIYALTQTYKHAAGLGGASVWVMGKEVGTTDQFGRFSYVYTGKPDDLVTISLKTKGYLPEAFETDFVASGAMSLVKYFTPVDPPPLRVAVLKPVAAGELDAAGRSFIGKELDATVQSAAHSFLFASTAFVELPFAKFDAALHRSGQAATDLLRHGWQDSEVKGSVDALLVPTVIGGSKPVLELSLVDSNGHVAAAAKEELAGLGDRTAIEQAVASIAKKIVRVYPFEGAVLRKDVIAGKAKVTINLGQSRGRGVKIGDSLDVYGMQTEKNGRRQVRARIATLVVRELADASASTQVGWLAPRATIERGDLVVLRPRQAPPSKAAELLVTTKKGGEVVPLAQANVYLNDIWLGATASNGRLTLDEHGSGTLRVIKPGYSAFRQAVEITASTHLSASLQQEAAFLRVASSPAGATVKVDGAVIGKTPLPSPVPVASGFVKLELSGLPGYKPYSSVLELDAGTLDLSGDEQVVLERDELAAAHALLKAGKVEAALATLNAVPKDHSDYLSARHEAGELYLSKLDQPAKAAEAFGQVTANEAVRLFNDKRFIASHVDEGIALFMTAERLIDNQPDAARAHYQKALAVFDGVLPYLRFIDAKEYAQAVHNVYYHRALCQHRLWSQTQDPRLLNAALHSWRGYLNGSARTVPVDAVSRTYVDNAEIYLKQASASVNSARNSSRQ